MREYELPNEYRLGTRGSLNNRGEAAAVFSNTTNLDTVGVLSPDGFQVVATLDGGDQLFVSARNNNVGDVVFTASPTDLSTDENRRIGVFRGGEVAYLPIVLDDAFIGSALAINDLGAILFSAVNSDIAGLASINVWIDDGFTTIAKVGNTLDDKIILSLFAGPNSLSNQSEVAFWVQFADLTTAIYTSRFGVLQEIPIPPAIALFGVGIAAIGAASRRKKNVV
ncbi:MAG: hypothetical protein ACKVS5_11855 [Parvularculaceae bacterium]